MESAGSCRTRNSHWKASSPHTRNSCADDELEPEEAPAWGSAFTFATEAEPDLETASQTEPESEPLGDIEPATLTVADADLEKGLGPEPELEPESTPESDVDADPKLAPFSTLAEPAAAALVWDVESAPDTPADMQPTWTTASAPPEADADELQVVNAVDAVDGDSDVDSVDAVDTDAERDPEANSPAKPRSRVLTATIVLACLFVVVVAAVLGVRAVRHPSHATTATAPPVTAAPPARTAPTVQPSQNVARIQTATDAVDSATDRGERRGHVHDRLPDPYQCRDDHEPVHRGTAALPDGPVRSQVPAAARPSEVSAQAQLRQDLVFLDTIDGLPPAQLGAYLAQFDSDATSLQTTLSTLEQNLRAPAS